MPPPMLANGACNSFQDNNGFIPQPSQLKFNMQQQIEMPLPTTHPYEAPAKQYSGSQHTKAVKKARAQIIYDYMKHCRNPTGVQSNPEDYDENGNCLKKCDQLCFNWVATAKCWRDPCPFAHGQEELTDYGVASYGDKYKKQNCRNFFNFRENRIQHCHFGANCLFRHEHRPFSKLHRRHYGLHLSKYESLFHSNKADKAKTAFLRSYAPDTKRLEVFSQISDAEQLLDAEADDWQIDAELEE